jgi:ubiquinone/menaquinone biosynthesis C-methylase UbiE
MQININGSAFDKGGIEFDRWANLESVRPQEEYLLKKFLEPHHKIIEAGTGGGRILFFLNQLGFAHLSGFDLFPAMIEVANQRKGNANINFEAQNASALSYPDSSFDRAIYMVQIMSFINNELDRLSAFQEAHRILKTDGVLLLALVCFDCRMQEQLFALYSSYIKLFRKLTGSDLSVQTTPWLKHHGKPNWGALIDRGDSVYAYKIDELTRIFDNVGFEVIGIGTDSQLLEGKIYNTKEELIGDRLEGQLYLACRKKG